MKKKVIVIMLTIVMILGVVACGKKQEEINEENDATSNVEQEKENENEIDTEEVEKEENKTSILTGTYKVPLQEIYVDIPELHMIEEGYAQLFMESDSKYVAFVCLYYESETDAKNAWEPTFTTLKGSLQGYHHIEELNEVQEASVEVNGIETYQIKGTVKYGSDNLYIYGYSFVFNTFPCSIVGVVEDPAQLQEDIDNVTEIVDAMMASVRNEE